MIIFVSSPDKTDWDRNTNLFTIFQGHGPSGVRGHSVANRVMTIPVLCMLTAVGIELALGNVLREPTARVARTPVWK